MTILPEFPPKKQQTRAVLVAMTGVPTQCTYISPTPYFYNDEAKVDR